MSVSRRRVLTTTAVVTLGTVAGCSGITNHEFEATPVRLPDADQKELQLAETAFGSNTVTRKPSVGGIEGEVTITSYTAINQRGPARGTPTVMEAALSGVNETVGSGAAVVVSGDALGIDELALPVFENEPIIPGSGFSLVVPEGARTGNEVALSKTILLVSGTAFPGSQWVPGDSWVPGSQLVPGDSWVPGSGWIPGRNWIPDDPESLQVLMMRRVGEMAGPLFDLEGADYDELPGRSLEEGEAFETENSIVALPGSVVGTGTYDNVFNVGVPAPLGGATFGIGVLSTPAAKVADQPVNPIAGIGFQDLLTSGQASGLLKQAGVTDADNLEWLSGPTPVADIASGGTVTNPSPVAASILGQETSLKTFLGVVSGKKSPWGVGVHMARVEKESDIVIAAGFNSWPVRSAEYFDLDRGKRFSGILGSIIDRARALTDAAGERFEDAPF